MIPVLWILLGLSVGVALGTLLARALNRRRARVRRLRKASAQTRTLKQAAFEADMFGDAELADKLHELAGAEGGPLDARASAEESKEE